MRTSAAEGAVRPPATWKMLTIALLGLLASSSIVSAEGSVEQSLLAASSHQRQERGSHRLEARFNRQRRSRSASTIDNNLGRRRKSRSTIVVDSALSIVGKQNDTVTAFAREAFKVKPGVNVSDVLDADLMAKVKANLADNAHHSWVSGTQAQAILELDYPRLSVFSPNYYGRISEGAHSPEVNDIAKYWLDQLPSDAQQFVIEGAAGDTASVGVAFVNAGLNPNGTDGAVFDTFAARETDWLLTAIPRMENGAISHRPPHEPPQVWADNFYMSPPYLAYYGIATKNISVAKEAFTQIAAMRDILRDPETNLLMHVIGGHWEDRKLWGTGIAWAIAGISRVYATYLYSPFTGTFDRERNQLAQWANELVTAVLPYISDQGLLPNTYGWERGFDDSASSALIAASIYRMAQLGFLNNDVETLAQAERIRQGVYAKIDRERGWVASCADPLEFYTVSNESPESLAFLMLLDASVNSYKAITSPNQKGSSLLELKANLTVVADRPVQQV